ncbi:MAG: translation initiation factor IF-2 [Rhodospirillaceae bacterium]|nr:translation initiation factor IF-2 [Rhodospirillaceae bacterium]
MAETKQDEEKKPLTLSRPGRLELKKTVESGVVKQSFSHGRSKTVAVEVKKKRTFRRGESGRMAEVKEEAAQSAEGAFAEKKSSAGPMLSQAEREARLRALKQADATHGRPEHPQAGADEPVEIDRPDLQADPEVVVEVSESVDPGEAPQPDLGGAAPEDAVPAETETVAEAVPGVVQPEDEQPDLADEEKTRRFAEERAKADDLARQLASQELGVGFTPSSKVAPKPAVRPSAPPPDRGAAAGAADPGREEDRDERRRKAEPKRPAAGKRGEPRRRTGRLTITQALEIGDAGMERKRSEAAARRRREKEKQRAQKGPIEHRKQSREVVVPETITVQELANRMAEKGADLVKALMKMGVMATMTQSIDADTAELLVEEFGHKIRRVSEADVEIGLEGAPDPDETLKPRAPVVTIMGHVDHGKTSLLDALRETDVAGREAGGITQHIGAYRVNLASGGQITFLDTPGHAAFTEMRSRGATVTDIVILVVAADDGVQPQTIEAIAHAKAAEVPIIVAVNKIDTRGADANRVMTALLQHDIQVEPMGGDVLCIEVSATEKTNLDKLEEAILLQAELMDLRANPDREAQGVVVEAKLERGRGAVATVLVQRGTLEVGDIFVVGQEWGRVRALVNDRGEPIKAAGPSAPVEVLGLNGTPGAGDDFLVVGDEGRAREISEYRQRVAKKDAGLPRSSIEQMFSRIQAGEAQELPILIKTDVQGSAEAISGMLDRLSTDEVKVQILHSGVGAISESDITLAKASEAMILAFNVRANSQARDLAARDGIDIRYYSIIYDINDDIKAMLSGMLAPEIRETFLGYAEILEVFKVSKVGNVAGCRVTEGVVRRGSGVRLLRDSVVIHEGKLATLKRFKDEVREVHGGMECGMSFDRYQDIRIGDQIECFEVEEVQRTL